MPAMASGGGSNPRAMATTTSSVLSTASNTGGGASAAGASPTSKLKVKIPEQSGSRLSMEDDPSTATRSGRFHRSQPFFIGVAGGTASGKTTVCDCIMQRLHDQCVVMLSQDSFYRGLTPEEEEHVAGEAQGRAAQQVSREACTHGCACDHTLPGNCQGY